MDARDSRDEASEKPSGAPSQREHDQDSGFTHVRVRQGSGADVGRCELVGEKRQADKSCGGDASDDGDESLDPVHGSVDDRTPTRRRATTAQTLPTTQTKARPTPNDP